jgi:hypothetical protein
MATLEGVVKLFRAKSQKYSGGNMMYVDFSEPSSPSVRFGIVKLPEIYNADQAVF